MANGQGVTLPAGYEDAKPVVQAGAAPKGITLPAGYEDARPAVEATGRPQPPPNLAIGAGATGIGPRKLGMYGSGPIESRIEDFMNPTAAYKKEHPILGGLGEGLRNLRETFTPGVMAAATLLGGPGGPSGEIGPIAPKGPSVPAMSLPGRAFPRVSVEPRSVAAMPQTVFDEPRQLGPVRKHRHVLVRLDPFWELLKVKRHNLAHSRNH